MDLRPRRYYYTVVALDGLGEETTAMEMLPVEVTRVITLEEARERGLVGADAQLAPGDAVQLALHPLGTDYLGRDMLARLMHGARVSLFIGICRPVPVRAVRRRLRQRRRLSRRSLSTICSCASPTSSSPCRFCCS